MTRDGVLMIREHPKTEPLVEKAKKNGYRIEVPSSISDADARYMPEREVVPILDLERGEQVGGIIVEFDFYIDYGWHGGRYVTADIESAELDWVWNPSGYVRCSRCSCFYPYENERPEHHGLACPDREWLSEREED